MDVTAEAEKRIKACGYTDAVDTDYLKLMQADQEQHIKDYCNLNVVPDDLEHVLARRTAGAFLREQYALGKVGGDDVSSITEGDVSLSFGSATKYQSLINTLLDDAELIRYRRLEW